MHRSRIAVIAALLLATLPGCGTQESSADRRERASSAIAACRDHQGVAAFDDDAVICADGSFAEERGEGAVEACGRHDGVSAFDDDIVICRDGTFHFVEGG